jgi:hypothetical protein
LRVSVGARDAQDRDRAVGGHSVKLVVFTVWS